MDTDLVRSVARGLCYRPLDHLIGRVVEIRDLQRIEEAVRLALAPDLPTDCSFVGPEPHSCGEMVAKYGILDLRFTAPAERLIGDGLTGVPLLRELGFLSGGDEGPQHSVCDDPTCLEMLQVEVAQERTWLLLFLDDGKSGAGSRNGGPRDGVSFGLPAVSPPGEFKVMDACVTNAASVWMWKHFYL